MDDVTQTVVLHIDENLDGFNENLEFKYTDDEFSFNFLDNGNTQDGYRFTCNVINNETTLEALDGATAEDEINKDAVAVFTEGDSDFIVLTDDYLAIPIFEGFNINYIVSTNMDLQQNHIDAINNVSVCLTTVSELETEYKSIQTTIVPLDFSQLSSQGTTPTSIFSLAVTIQKDGKNGVEAINKYLYSTYKNTKAVIETDTDKNVETQEVVKDEADVLVTTKDLPDNTTTVVINLEDLTVDAKYQQRVRESSSAIDDLATAYRDGEAVPFIKVVDTGSEKIIVDGFHRYSGAKEAGLSSLECHVIVGTEEEALIEALGANAENKALKRTNQDKRKAVITAKSSPEFKAKSNRDIANICKVSPGLVDKIVKELELQSNASSDSLAHVGTDDKTEIVSAKPINNESDAYIGSDDTNAEKITTPSRNLTEKISNDLVSLSIIVKTPSNEIALSNLLADLKAMIDEYVSELEEV